MPRLIKNYNQLLVCVFTHLVCLITALCLSLSARSCTGYAEKCRTFHNCLFPHLCNTQNLYHFHIACITVSCVIFVLSDHEKLEIKSIRW